MTVPHPLMRQLAAARQQAGLSLDEWSARLGMQLSTVSYLERGISSLSLAALERLAGDLGYKVVLQPAAPAQPAMHTGGNAEDCPACAPGIDKTVLYPWICPGNGPDAPAQPATDATGDTDTTGGAGGGTDDLSAIRDRIADALTAEHYRRAHEQIVAPVEEHQAAFADVVVDAIRPELERLERHRRQAENRAQLFRDQAAAEHERAEQVERDRDQLRRDIIDASEEIHDLKNDVARQRKDLKIREIQVRKLRVHRQRYRTAWWSARLRAAKSRAAYAAFHDLLEEANATIAQIRKLHSRHECDDCGCRLCWGLLPVCTAGCAEYPCPTVRALDAGPEQTETDQHAACHGCETCELATELADARAAIDRVRRLCELTIAASCRVQAIEQARDTLAVLDRAEPDATGGDQ